MHEPILWIFTGEYEFLDNFYPSEMIIDSVRYPTVEHFFQSQKMLLKKDAVEVAKAKSPADAKVLGNNLTMRDDWADVRYDVMLRGVREKFKAFPELAKRLIETEDVYIEEGNIWHDNIWGNCICPECREVRGKNWLGEILMKVREEVK